MRGRRESLSERRGSLGRALGLAGSQQQHFFWAGFYFGTIALNTGGGRSLRLNNGEAAKIMSIRRSDSSPCALDWTVNSGGPKSQWSPAFLLCPPFRTG